MLSNNNHNSSCSYAEQIAAFIYDEITREEKLGFQAHLRNCQACADEVADFTLVRSSLEEWRAEEFAPLSTPGFEIPPAKSQTAKAVSRLESIRAYFSLSPATLSAGFAAVLFFIGFIWFFAAPNFKDQQIAENKIETINETVDLQPVETTENKISAISEENSPGETVVIPKPASRNQHISVSDSSNQVKSAQSSSRKRQTPRVREAVAGGERLNGKTANKTPRRNNVPTFSYEEYQDTSLRLSDILEEVSMK
jgi:hypothetical protein